jgi:hypothetical protein
MRSIFTTLLLLAATVTALAAPEPVPDDGDKPKPPHKDCLCPKDKYGDHGTHINQGYNWYQCAYKHGACQWYFVSDLPKCSKMMELTHRAQWGPLVNTRQTNCPKYEPCKYHY